MSDSKAETTRCTACGQSFRCGAEAGDARCWCFDMPKLPLRTGSASCYCPACLSKMANAAPGESLPSNDKTNTG